MANTATTSTVLDQSSDVAFRNWITEIFTQFTSTLTLSQTNDTGQINLSTAVRTASVNTAVGYHMFRYTDALSLGPIATTNALIGGATYTNGTYTAVPLTGGTGTGAKATITVAGAVVTSVVITTPGTGYNVCDALSALAANIGGTGSGFQCNVATLTSGSPVVFKLEYGTGGTATIAPQMFISFAQGSNGAGTLIGNVSSRQAVSIGTAASSLVTAYTSRFVVNMTVGYVALAWKLNAQGSTASVSQGGFKFFRSNDTSGNPTGDSINLITNSINTTGSSSNAGIYQGYSYLTSQFMPINGVPTLAQNGGWLGSSASSGMPFNLTSTLVGGFSYSVPEYYLTPVPCVSAFGCATLLSETPIGTTFSEAIIGATPHTFLNVGQPYGSASLGVINTTLAGENFLWE